MPARPIVHAQGMGLRLSSGWAYRNVDLVVLPGEMVAVLGPEEHRVPLVLTLGAELVPTAGALRLCGYTVPAEITRVRPRLAIARHADNAANRPGASVGEYVRNTLLLADLPTDGELFAAAADLVGFAADPTTLVADLSADDAALLGIALAVTTPVELLVVVNADDGLEDGHRDRVWSALDVVTRTGTAVVAGASAAPDTARVVTIPSDTSNSVP